MNQLRAQFTRNHVSRPIKLGLSIGVGLLVSTLSACGIPDDDRPREIDPALLENITDQT
jgi:hypothetical protein